MPVILLANASPLDTVIPVQPSGVLATIGVLPIIAAHMGARHTRSLPAA